MKGSLFLRGLSRGSGTLGRWCYLDMAESKPISHIIISPESIRVRPGDSSESISCLLSGTVDVAVAKGVVLVLVLGVELAGGDGGDSRSGSSNNGSSSNSVDSINSWGSSNSVDSSYSWGSSNSVDGGYSRDSGNSADSSNCMDSRNSSNCTVSSNSWGSVSTGISIGIAKSSPTIGTIGTVVESISSAISGDGGHKGRDKNQNLHVVILLLLLNGVPCTLR